MNRAFLWILLSWVITATASGQPVDANGEGAPSKPMVREIFVPFDELNVLLESDVRRVFLERAEYDELLKKAKSTPTDDVPVGAVVLSAAYDGAIDEQRATIHGTLEIEVLEDGLQALALAFSGVGIRAATIGGQAAAVGLDGQGGVTLFVAGRGRHSLSLELVAPLQTSAAQQTLDLRLPTPAATKFALTVPGNVELKSGAQVIRRKVDQAAEETRFDLLLPRERTALVMSLNNRMLQRQRVVVARSVVVDEVTSAYERLHVTMTLDVLHGAAERFRFTLPDGFEPTHVESPVLARWEVVQAADARELEVVLRSPETETVTLQISATRTPAQLSGWSMPRLIPLDVAGQVAIVGLVVEDRLQTEALSSSGLMPLDNAVMQAAMPGTVLAAEPGAPRWRRVATYYAPGADFELTARFQRPEAKFAVTSNVLLTLEPTGHQAKCAFVLTPEMEKLFIVRIAIPAGWHVSKVTDGDGATLATERFDDPQAGSWLQVRLARGIPVGESATVLLEATSVPSGWLGDWETQQVAFPAFAVLDAATDEGALAIQADEDFIVRPDQLVDVMPLDNNEKAKYGLGDVSSRLAYRYDRQPYEASLVLTRQVPSVTARCFSFLRISPETLSAHYEVVYDVRQARTRQLALLLPKDTPRSLSINGLDDITLKETRSEEQGDVRRWIVSLSEAAKGVIRLTVDFDQPTPDKSTDRYELPLPRADGVEYESGIVAVEGHADLDISVDTTARLVDVGELAASDYRVGRRLLGAYSYVGAPPAFTVDERRRPGYELRPAIVQRAELWTQVSASGCAQTAARYQLRTKVQFLEVELPQDAELWSVYLDGKPVAPQREGEHLLLSLPADNSSLVRDLQVVFETPVSRIALSGEFRTLAPKLLLREEQESQSHEIPTADLVWRLQLPEGYELVRTSGTVFTDHTDSGRYRDPRRSPAAIALAVLYEGLGGFMSPIQAARESARRAQVANSLSEYAGAAADLSHYYLEDSADYDAPQSADGEAMYGDEYGAYGSQFESGYGGGDDAMPAEAAPMDKLLPEPEITADGAMGMGGMGGGGFQPGGGPSGQLPPPPSGEGSPSLGLPPGNQPSMPTAGGRTAADPGRPSPPPPAPPRRKAWALEGIRSLQIDLQPTGEEIVFQSLGDQPKLNVTVVHCQRMESLAWSVGALVLLAGLMLTRRRVRAKAKYVIVTGVLALLLPPLLGMSDEPARVFDTAFFAACLLVPYYLLVGLLAWLSCRCCRGERRVPAPAAAAVLLAAFAWGSSPDPALAQSPPPAIDASALLDLLVPAQPVQLPEDAVIIPYKLDDGERAVEGADRVLVPYAKYVELWNRAFPDQRIQAEPPVAPWSLAGASYQATLADDDDLMVQGHVDIEVFSDRPVQIPLRLEGGVLELATLDGKPARLQLVQPEETAQQRQQPAPNAAPSQQLAQQAEFSPPDRFAILHVSGTGRKRLELTIRMKLERRGGWRLAAGRLPVAPATALTLTAPAARTEVRLSRVPDRSSYETVVANEKIETALAADGGFGIQWRPQVAEGEVDRSLTVQSDAVLDVREDRLRLLWRLQLEFPRSRRDAFTVLAPSGYLIEKVGGDNVRGWTAQEENGRQRIDVTLLKESQTAETLTLTLSRRDIVSLDGASQFQAPVVTVEGAALHKGRLTLRRSPSLELTVAGAAGMTRANIDADAVSQLLGAAAEDNALPIQPYQAYDFTAVPFVMPVKVAPLPSETTAVVYSLLRIAERESALECAVNLRVQGRPAYQLRLAIPPTLEIEQLVAPGDFNWAVTDEGGRRVLSVYLGQGQQDAFEVRLQGSLGDRKAADPVAAPNLEVLDVVRQQGDLVVQLDPAFAVQATDLKNCHPILLDRVQGWLAAGQKTLARLALHYDQPDYAASFQISSRPPRVNGYTVTNVKVTDVAIEDTIMIDLSIRDAGIRSVSFLLPAWMKNLRIHAPMLRQQTITDADDGQTRVHLEFQGEIFPDYRVLIEHDRPLTAGGQAESDVLPVPIPVLEDVRTDQRYVTLEEAGRDELEIVDQTGLELLARQQAERRWLAGILGDSIKDAFRVNTSSEEPRLAFKTKPLQAVQTAGAQIGLAETLLVVDANGAYRGQQTYHVNNTTEQFLVVQLPAGATLWTATVAGEPVKPTLAPAENGAAGETDAAAALFLPDQVRIPLIKTAEGDRDYAVVLKYGGRTSPLRNLRKVDFPLLHTVNIRVELSQVRLRVPETFRWFDFDGTMRPVYDEGDFKSGFFVYNTKQVDRLQQVLSGGNAYARLRAQSNLKSIDVAVQDFQTANPDLMSNEAFNKNYIRNTEIVAEAQRQADESLQFAEGEVELDNRTRLNAHWMRQSNGMARNVVTDLAPNFPLEAAQQAQPETAAAERFNYRWLDDNGLNTIDSGVQVELQNRLESNLAKNPVRGKFQALNEGNYFNEGKPAEQAGQGQAAAASGKQRQQVLSQRELAREYQEQLKQDEQQLEGLQQRDNPPQSGLYDPMVTDGQAATRLYDQQRGQQGLPSIAVAGPGSGTVAFSPEGRAMVAGGSDGTVTLWTVPQLASLDVELPGRGVELLFTMARGDIQITARPVERTLIDRLYHLAAILIGLAGLWVAYRLLRWAAPFVLNTRAGAAMLLVAALLCLVIGLLPIAALVVIVAAIMQLVRIPRTRRTTATAA